MSAIDTGIVKTAPFDARFPNQNQTRNCYQNYIDFHRCKKIKGEAYKPCEYFQKVYKSICPNEWVRDPGKTTNTWDSQQENGTFAGKI